MVNTPIKNTGTMPHCKTMEVFGYSSGQASIVGHAKIVDRPSLSKLQNQKYEKIFGHIELVQYTQCTSKLIHQQEGSKACYI